MSSLIDRSMGRWMGGAASDEMLKKEARSTHGRVVAVVPALDEAPRIARVIETLPASVHTIVLVDDGSSDDTSARAIAVGDRRLIVVRHDRPRGVGAAIAAGYRVSISLGAACAVVLAGDGQMDPSDLAHVTGPILGGDADYVKGNRFAHVDGARAMPRARRIGGELFSAMTRLATGLDVDDTQCGYTAIGARALTAIDWSSFWSGFGYPNALLVELARRGLRVREVPVRAVYGDEESKLRLRHLPPIAGLLARAAWARAHAVVASSVVLADPTSTTTSAHVGIASDPEIVVDPDVPSIAPSGM